MPCLDVIMIAFFPRNIQWSSLFPQKACVNTEQVPPEHPIILLKSNKFNMAAVLVKKGLFKFLFTDFHNQFPPLTMLSLMGCEGGWVRVWGKWGGSGAKMELPNSPHGSELRLLIYPVYLPCLQKRSPCLYLGFWGWLQICPAAQEE